VSGPLFCLISSRFGKCDEDLRCYVMLCSVCCRVPPESKNTFAFLRYYSLQVPEMAGGRVSDFETEEKMETRGS
jgi:hypothetical protein